jgi:two-component system nitrogen regulation response regulator GlnG
MAELERRPWHGNVRELRNAVEHALILARQGEIVPEHLPPPAAPWVEDVAGGAGESESLDALIRRWAEATLSDPARAGQIYDQFLAQVEPPLFAAALAKHRGQCASAARSLGLHRTTLKKKLDQYGIAGDEG